MAILTKESFIELNGRERAKAVLDRGTFRELLGPFDGMESPHLVPQGIVPESDDGVIIARGTIDGNSAVVISIEGAFQGGGIGEVSGSKIAGALELALKDNEHGQTTYPIMLFDTGGVRLQEANYGLLSIAEIGSAVSALREYIPVIGVIPGNVGCFGGMSITAALFSHLIMTKGGRFGLNGPEVIEQEAGIEEFDSTDRSIIWGTIGGLQRYETGFVDYLVNDDVHEIVEAIEKACKEGKKEKSRTEQIALYRSLLDKVDPSMSVTAEDFRQLWKEQERSPVHPINSLQHNIDKLPESRGRTWFTALTGIEHPKTDIPSVLYGDTQLENEFVRYIAVVPNPNNRFPRARNGEVGLDEGWAIARCVREAIEEDKHDEPRPIIAIVDVPSQAYGFLEELFGIHFSCAAAVDAYAQARRAGHPVISLIVGKAISAAFLAHGYQANRILALHDKDVHVHAMSKSSVARITKRSIAELDEATKKVPAMAYDIDSYNTLGTLHDLIDDIHADAPTKQEIQRIQSKLRETIQDIRNDSSDLMVRLRTDNALVGRKASIAVREKLAEQWN